MAYRLLCSIPFKSFNGTPCLIQVLTNAVTGPSYTLDPADPSSKGYAAEDPFYFSEDNSHNVLEFVRTKTGYIRLVERKNDSLKFLYPSKEMEHYVRVYYGEYNEQTPHQNLVFTGYITCQTYTNDWVAAPNVREFPVVSPLGHIDDTLFDVREPQVLTMGSVLAELMGKISEDCQSVIWPGGRFLFEGDFYGILDPWDGKIHSIAICPFNGDFDHRTEDDQLYKPKSLSYFLNGVCASNGWMVHDEPTGIVFTSIGNNGYYDRLTIQQLADLPFSSEPLYNDIPNNVSTQFIDEYFEVSGDDGNLSVEQPLSKVIVRAEGSGEFSKPEPLDYTNQFELNIGSYGGANNYVALLAGKNASPMAVSSFWRDAMGVAGPDIKGVFPGGFSKIEKKSYEKASVPFPSLNWVMRYESWMGGSELLKLRYFGPMTKYGYLLCRPTLKMGNTISTMQSYENWWNFFDISVSMDGGVITAFRPNADQQINFARFGDTYGCIIIQVVGDVARVVNSLDIAIGNARNVSNNKYIEFDISISDPENYRYFQPRPQTEYVQEDPQRYGKGEESITCDIHRFSLSPSDTSYGDKDGNINGEPPDFRYMLSPREILEIPVVRNNSPMPANIYLPRWVYWRDNGYLWRVVAVEFHLHDDEYRLTLVHTNNLLRQ